MGSKSSVEKEGESEQQGGNAALVCSHSCFLKIPW